jgi:spoIIIJ-associated protein
VVEVRARTVDEAVARGLVRLGGLSRSEVQIEVLSEGKGGLLGFGVEEASVRLTTLLPGERAEVKRAEEELAAVGEPVEAPSRDEPDARQEEEASVAPAAAAAEPRESRPPRERPARDDLAMPDAEAEATVREYLERLLEMLGCQEISIERESTLLPVEIDDEESVVFSIRGGGTERLLRDEAQPLLALQFLVRLAATRLTNTWTNLLLDVNQDRKRRMKELFHLSEQSAELVEREGRPVSLPPMSPYERRVVHLALRDHETVATQSIGSGDTRKVTVRLKGQLLPGI